MSCAPRLSTPRNQLALTAVGGTVANCDAQAHCSHSVPGKKLHGIVSAKARCCKRPLKRSMACLLVSRTQSLRRVRLNSCCSCRAGYLDTHVLLLGSRPFVRHGWLLRYGRQDIVHPGCSSGTWLYLFEGIKTQPTPVKWLPQWHVSFPFRHCSP